MPCSMKKFTQQMNRCRTSLQVPSGYGSVSKDNVREMFLVVLHLFEYILLKNNDIYKAYVNWNVMLRVQLNGKN